MDRSLSTKSVLTGTATRPSQPSAPRSATSAVSVARQNSGVLPVLSASNSSALHSPFSGPASVSAEGALPAASRAGVYSAVSKSGAANRPSSVRPSGMASGRECTAPESVTLVTPGSCTQSVKASAKSCHSSQLAFCRSVTALSPSSAVSAVPSAQ